ncbi:hypothetical protein LX16_0831 [Stackebrandtia albiflava]|uniref:Uncharacterized protein n=1 Tax=Stackebrandtia albiflava TaxID=406432 RepID=A0A562VB79_9ACTN|nr:hypothetical protein [Stackebrandtia albiflava]TWJ15132.1 hypothetical protein LX16_0831 [Stackebrandtia albiflava]
MIDWLTAAIQILALLAAAWYLVETLRKRPVLRRHMIGMAVLEAVVVVQLVVSIVLLLGQSGSADTVMFIGYLATTVLVLPVAAIWGSVDRSHWGTAVVCGACLTVAAVLMRMDQIWRMIVA